MGRFNPLNPLSSLMELALKGGPLVPMGGQRYLINSPNGVRQVLQRGHLSFEKTDGVLAVIFGRGLLTAVGKQWREQRREAQPFFRVRTLERWRPPMQREAERLAQRWGEAAAGSRPTNVAADMSRLTLRIVTRILFGFELEPTQEARLLEVIVVALKALGNAAFLPGMEHPRQRPAFRKALEEVWQILEELIVRRLGHPLDPEELFSVLGHGPTPGGGQQLRNRVMTLLLAGLETTANGLAWTWHLLGTHPDVRARFEEALADKAPVRAAFVDRLVQESLRLYPPIWTQYRRCLDPMEVEGVLLARDSIAVISQWTMHRHPELWPDPERFEPDRFLTDPVESRPRFAYFPFGVGPRRCIGEHLALMELKEVLPYLAERFQLDPVPRVPVIPFPNIVSLRPRYGLPMRIRRR